jgi:putative transposase
MLEYRIDYSRKPFVSKDQACQWVSAFVDYEYHQHRHSAIKFVTPQQRYGFQAVGISWHRAAVHEYSRLLNLRQWSRPIRSRPQREVVWSNRPSDNLDYGQKLPLIQA